MRTPCSRCGGANERWPKQRYCQPCHNAYVREWNKTNPHPYKDLSEERQRKVIARAYAGVYKRRGLLIEHPCEQCGERAEMHHPDYFKPLNVVWLCRQHHREIHAS